ncbi:LAGLIDADG family homing endonuclease [Candidatus Woesearchaeota archaeon]|nr:LAGLIDADG family homing endonuclease [Candidatus Woesearchaeota archaeon]
MNQENSEEYLADVCGIHAGDGWMASTTNEVGYGTSPKEEQYFQEVLQLYSKLFKLTHLRILRRKAVEFRFQSKEVQQQLIRLGFSRVKKLESLHTPKFIFYKKEFMIRFLRGLVDTDGCVYWRKSVNHHYLIIYWVTTSEKLADEIMLLLSNLGYSPRKESSAGNRQISQYEEKYTELS